ncbi:hypothetical protein TRICI_002743 [Trichomonascus ciferrii]|uniref:Vacuolar protein sorting-associated protein 62 n=1 Tax=Trichomonascus ciferrii TaxID=44093 RepID=A0A642V737_9ASCO|nr:hypothetical protein TRICI_002743 [Trichomonascus ciferrii]
MRLDLLLLLGVAQCAIEGVWGMSLWDLGRPHTKEPYDPETTTIPDYVTRYAPLVHLYSEETYWPYGIEDYVPHFTLQDGLHRNVSEGRLRLQDLEHYRRYGLGELFLTAKDDFDNDPAWITGRENVPDIETGRIRGAPATCIVVDKGDGVVDAFWFYFYSFNLGPFVMGGGPYGNHIGDWEHSLVRFIHGEPHVVWMSAHGGGAAYDYAAMEKLSADRRRPVIFSARGTHANYASVGQHSHDLPFYMLSDFTDRGPLWDPTENFLAYMYDGTRIASFQQIRGRSSTRSSGATSTARLVRSKRTSCAQRSANGPSGGTSSRSAASATRSRWARASRPRAADAPSPSTTSSQSSSSTSSDSSPGAAGDASS